MSVRVQQERKAKDPNNREAYRAFRIAKVIATAFYVLSTAELVITLATLPFLAFSDPNAENARILGPILSQNIFCDFAVTFIAYHVYHIVDSCKDRESFFAGNQAKRLRLIAAMLALVFFVQVALWLHFAQFGLEGIPFPISEPWYLFGFPSGSVWDAALSHATKLPKIEATADINFGIAIMSLVTWCLSYAFERGLILQQENDQTI